MRWYFVLLLLPVFAPKASENLSDHEQFCLQDTSLSCEQYIEQQLSAAPPFSHRWYGIKAHQLNFLFHKHQFVQLQQETERLLAQQSLPDVFRVQLYFYHAKALFYFNRHDDAKVYANQAVDILQDTFAAFGNPLRMVELANLQYSLGEFAKAEQLLRFTQSRYAKSKDPVLLIELNANLALLSDQQADFAASAAYRTDVLAAAMLLGHEHKIIVAMGNLARTKQLLGQLTEALTLYQHSLHYTAAPEHKVQHSSHLLRLTEICLALNQSAQASRYFEQIEPTLLSSAQADVYQQLARKLTQIAQ